MILMECETTVTRAKRALRQFRDVYSLLGRYQIQADDRVKLSMFVPPKMDIDRAKEVLIRATGSPNINISMRSA